MGRKPYFLQPVHLQSRVEAWVRELLDRLAAHPSMKSRVKAGHVSYGQIITVLVKDEAARLGVAAPEGALLTDQQLKESHDENARQRTITDFNANPAPERRSILRSDGEEG